MAGKGRRKTGNILVNDKGARLVCFSKRRLGLFKKAEELAILTGAQVGAIVFSPAGKPMAFNVSSLEALIERFVPEESQSGNDWESRFQRYLKGEGASDWWMRADVQSMGIEEVRRFKNAILSDRKKRPYDVMAGELTSHDVESSFHPQTLDDNLKKKNKKKKLSHEQPMNPTLPSSSSSVDANDLSDASFFAGGESVDDMDFSCGPLPWYQFPEQQQLLQWWNDEYSMNDNIQCSCPDMQPIRDITPLSSSDESFFSGEPSIDAMDTNLPWNNLPEFQQQQNDAIFMEASLPHSFSDFQPSADNQTSFSLGARFFPRGQSVDSMDSPTISLPCNESFEQHQMTDDWLMNVILANDAGHQSSLEQQDFSLDLAPTADFFPSVEAMDSSFSALPWYEPFEQQMWADDWQMNATLANDAFQGNQISNEQLEISHDLVPFEDLFS